MTRRFHIIVPAAGTGTRMAASLGTDNYLPKQYLQLAGKPILERTLSRLALLEPASLCLVVGASDSHWQALPSTKNCQVTEGGATRAESVMAGLLHLKPAADDIVLVHDAVRPLFTETEVRDLIKTAMSGADGALLVTPVVDTLKYSEAGKVVSRTEPRQNYWLAQTPQAFPAGLLLTALDQAASSGFEVTDEASAIEALGRTPAMVLGSKRNLKITTADDLAYAEFLLGQACQSGELQ